MIRIRPYKDSDVDTILLWCQDEKAFYQWTAGILGNYPITQKEFCFIESVMPFTAFEIYGAKKVSLGVFENNLPACYCYKAVGFSDVVLDTTEKYCILGEEWKCKELIMKNR